MIRPANSQDLPRLIDLIALLFASESDFTIDQGKQKRGLELVMSSPLGTVLVIEDSGLIVGMISGQMVFSTSEGAPSVWVEDVVVDPLYRGRRHGTALLKALEEWGRSQGATRFQLLADEDNLGAHSFYQMKGWKTTHLKAWRKT